MLHAFVKDFVAIKKGVSVIDCGAGFGLFLPVWNMLGISNYVALDQSPDGTDSILQHGNDSDICISASVMESSDISGKNRLRDAAIVTFISDGVCRFSKKRSFRSQAA